MMVNLRLSALGKFENKLPLASASRDEDRGERGRRPVIFENRPVDCPIYLRSGLQSRRSSRRSGGDRRNGRDDTRLSRRQNAGE